MKTLSIVNVDLLDRSRCSGAEAIPQPNPYFSALPDITSADIGQGLANHEFKAYYQPKLSLKNGVFTGAGVRARWDHPQHGKLTPAQFLPAVRQHDLVEVVFFEMFEQAMLLRRTLSAFDFPMGLTFELEPSQLRCKALFKKIRDWLEEYQCPASRITFEVTETGSTYLTSICLKNLLQLRALGCSLSMNEFGTGFSSLERLCDLPFNELKLDSSFVQRLHSHRSCRIVVQNTIHLTDTLGLLLVIEGVETIAQMKELEAMGCSLVQGLAIARPMPEQHFISYCMQYNAKPRKTSLCA